MTTREQIVNREILRWLTEQQALAAERAAGESPSPPRPVITVSRQIGSGGSLIAELLSERLGYHLFDRELIHAIAEQAGVQEEMVRILDERRRSGVDLWVEGVIRGRQFDGSDYLRALVRTVYLLARHGSAVIVGRGANFILHGEGAFHVRVVAPENERRSWFMKELNLTATEAAESVRESDRLQAEFVRRHFRREIGDPVAYHITINSGGISPEAAVESIAETLARLGWTLPSGAARRSAGTG